jgi:two-component system NtrC family sensor kinase
VARVVDDRLVGLASLRTPLAFARLQGARSASEWGFTRRFAAGATAYVESIEPGHASPEILAAAASVGLKAYAAFSFRDETGLAGVLICGFEQPASELPFDDRTIEAIGRVVDISFANERLRRIASASEERYRMVFERSPDALLVASLEGMVLEANPAATEMFGGPIVGKSGLELAEIDPSALRQILQRVQTEMALGWSGNGRRLDGTSFPIEADATALRVGGELRILGLIRDLTERRRLQHELLQAQKMEAIGLLVAGVAHELNNPLASIVAFSQLIRTDPRLPDELHHHADLLIQESNRTRRIVQNLLDFARQRPPERVPTSLARLIHRVLGLQSYAIGPNRIEATLDIADDLPLVALDRAQIQQVLINLTLNASQAISRQTEGRIRIQAALTDNEDGDPVVRVSVTDNGPGIPAHLRSRLFVPFFTTKAPGEGTGLGLSVSFGIVAAHDGALRYEPGPDGAGATFIMELPIDPDASDAVDDGWGLEELAAAAAESAGAGTAAGAEPDPDDRSGQSPMRILVLDDDNAIRDFLARVLRRDGYEPIVAADGRSALDLVRTERPAAILCDHRMAGMSGTAFHAAVAEIDPDLARRFAFMSGDVLNPELREFALARGLMLLAKPFDIDTVGRTVAQILEN